MSVNDDGQPADHADCPIYMVSGHLLGMNYSESYMLSQPPGLSPNQTEQNNFNDYPDIWAYVG